MNQAPTPARPDRVVLIKPSALGDVVTALPALRALKANWPQVHLTWLIRDSFAPLIRHDPEVDAVLTYNRRDLRAFWRSPSAWRKLKSLRRSLAEGCFDWALDMQGLARSGYFTKWTGAKVRAGFADARELAWRHYNHRVLPESSHTVDRNLHLVQALGVPVDGASIKLTIHEPSRQTWLEMLAQAGLESGQYLALAPTTTWQTKQYPLRHWQAVVARLARSRPIVLLGTPADREFCRRIQDRSPEVYSFAGRTDIRQFAAAIAEARGALCCDSACKFIAQGTGTPCLTLIGPTRPEQTGPWPGSNVTSASICARTACQGCKKKVCRHSSCMELIPPRRVAEAMENLLSGD